VDKPSAVEQHIDFGQRREEIVDRFPVKHIQDSRLDIRETVECMERVGFDIGRPNLGSLPSHRKSAGLADPLPGSRDNGNFSLEPHMGLLPVVVLSVRRGGLTNRNKLHLASHQVQAPCDGLADRTQPNDPSLFPARGLRGIVQFQQLTATLS